MQEYASNTCRTIFERTYNENENDAHPAYNSCYGNCQCDEADLVVFYLWPREQWDYDLVDAYQKRGGGLIFIHMALMQGSGQELSKRIGMAWDHRNGATKWGVLHTPVTLTDAALKSPIFEGFPAKFGLVDEFYWNLRGEPAGVTTLVTSPAGPAIANKSLNGPPKIEDLDGKK